MREPDFLIIGLQKSGTYWLTGLLNAHPEITCIPYLPMGQSGIREGRVFDTLDSIKDDGGALFTRVFSSKHNGFFSDLVPLLHKVSQRELYDKFRDRYSEYCNQYRNKKFIGEKTTEYVWCLHIIDEFYPNIKKICILRDVKDRIVSWHFQQIRKGRIKQSKIISDVLISEYCKRVKREYNSMLEYNGFIFCTTYEKMTTNPKNEIKKLLRYIGAQSSRETLNNIVQLGSFQHRTKINKVGNDYSRKPGQELLSSHFRKGIVGDWKNYLTKNQTTYINESIKEVQKRINEKFCLGGL